MLCLPQWRIPCLCSSSCSHKTCAAAQSLSCEANAVTKEDNVINQTTVFTVTPTATASSSSSMVTTGDARHKGSDLQLLWPYLLTSAMCMCLSCTHSSSSSSSSTSFSLESPMPVVEYLQTFAFAFILLGLQLCSITLPIVFHAIIFRFTLTFIGQMLACSRSLSAVGRKKNKKLW